MNGLEKGVILLFFKKVTNVEFIQEFYPQNVIRILVVKAADFNYYTLYFYNNEPSKNKHFLILLSSLARNSQKPKLKKKFEIP